jgi:predicted CoA-binding protein
MAAELATPELVTPELVTTQLSNGLSCDLPANSPLAKMLRSQRTWVGPDAKARLKILREAKSIAIVGMSPNPARSSYFVGTYLLQSTDYRVYFVNPNAKEILGQKVYPDLASLPEVPDIVDVFRKASDIPAVLEDVLAIGALAIWVQLGIYNEEAARHGEENGLTVVMDRCLKVEHARFHGGLRLFGFDTGVISARKAVR